MPDNDTWYAERLQRLRDESLILLLDRTAWSHYPYMPVRRFTAGATTHVTEVATLAVHESGYRVYNYNIFTGPAPDSTFTSYATVDEVLDAGWLVD